MPDQDGGECPRSGPRRGGRRVSPGCPVGVRADPPRGGDGPAAGGL